MKQSNSQSFPFYSFGLNVILKSKKKWDSSLFVLNKFSSPYYFRLNLNKVEIFAFSLLKTKNELLTIYGSLE